MNKEQLEKFIAETLNAPYFSSLYDIDMWREDKEELIRDLEILEFIKKHPIEFSWVVKSKTYTDYIFIGGTTIPFRFSEEEFNTIKEWLSNDK